MTTFIALFRGINVGGKNRLVMKELVALMENCGYENIQTYIQSGNVVFESKENPDSNLGLLIEEKFGFKPEILILTRSELELAFDNNPYKEVEGKLCHLYFCQEQPDSIDREKLKRLKLDSEQYFIHHKTFYLYAPDGFGRSKLAANVEKCLAVPATARNLNTARRLLEMVRY